MQQQPLLATPVQADVPLSSMIACAMGLCAVVGTVAYAVTPAADITTTTWVQTVTGQPTAVRSVQLPRYSTKVAVAAPSSLTYEAPTVDALQQPQVQHEAIPLPPTTSWANVLLPSAFVAMLASAIAWVRHGSDKTNGLEPVALAAYAGRPHGSVAMRATESATAQDTTTYYYIVANAQFMLYEEEHAMEVVREKRRFMKEKNMPRDFWFVPNPEFLDSQPEVDKRVKKPCCALVSTDEGWTTFMKLRYDKVIMGSFVGSTDVKEALKTKGGDPKAAVPEFEPIPGWDSTVPYPKYADDWYLPFLVGAEE